MICSMISVNCDACDLTFFQPKLVYGMSSSRWHGICAELLRLIRKNGWYVSRAVLLCPDCQSENVL